MISEPASETWSGDAQELWVFCLETYALETHHLVLLRQACEALTRAAEAKECILRDGLCILDRYNKPRQHPMADAERSSVNTARLCLREIGLDLDDKNESHRMKRARGYA